MYHMYHVSSPEWHSRIQVDLKEHELTITHYNKDVHRPLLSGIDLIATLNAAKAFHTHCTRWYTGSGSNRG